MWRHYFTVAIRNLRRNRGFTLINLAGLATGIAFCILSGLFVWHEWTYDHFYEKKDHIYRVVVENTYVSGPSLHAMVPENMGPLLADFMPQIEQATRIKGGSKGLVRTTEDVFRERPYFVDDDFFGLFSFPLLNGSPKTALKDLQSVVITERLAQKYFGDANPMGQELTVKHYEWRYEPKVFVVQGVVQNPPANSSIQFDMLLPIDVLPQRFTQRMNNGKSEMVPVSNQTIRFSQHADRLYVQLAKGADVRHIENQMVDFVAHHQRNARRRRDVALQLQPLTDVHFSRNIQGGLQPTSNPQYAYILSGISLAVLILACINFVNLAVARSITRSMEVGVRKMVGAKRGQLMHQFWGESVLLSCAAFVLGLALTEFFLPVFNGLIQAELVLDYNMFLAVVLLSMALVVGFGAGAYPAFLLSRFQAVGVLKQRFYGGGKNWFGRMLIVFQFAISALLVVSAVVMSGQLSYIQNKDLGFDGEQVVIVSSDDWVVAGSFDHSRTIRMQGLDTYRQKLLSYSGVVDATRVDRFVPEDPVFGPLREEINLPHQGSVVGMTFPVGADFLETMNITLLQGRNFSKEYRSDYTEAVIVNETFVKQLGLTKPIGMSIPFRKTKDAGNRIDVVHMTNPKIVGVVKDFHFQSLHEPLQPLVLHYYPKKGWDLFVRIRPENVTETLMFMKKEWEAVTGGAPFKYEFLDERINRQYQMEMRWGLIIRYASLFAVFVACLGVLGVTAQAVVRRTKEIGIRKVLGASIGQIVALLSKEFVYMVVIANVIALPLAYHIMDTWLQDFAYRIPLGVGIFSFSILLTLSMALLTVGLQALKAARANPVDALRYE